jgi:isopenicillin-N N-acyltransferase-like protein
MFVFGLIATGCSRDPGRQYSSPVPQIEPNNGIYYIKVSGTPREMGRQHGKQLKQIIQDQVKAYKEELIATFGEDNAKKIRNYVINDSKFLKDVQQHLPHVHQEMVGVAEGAEVDVKDILLLNMYEEVYEGATAALKIQPLPAKAAGKCTSLNCSGRKKLPNLNAQNLDYTPNLDGAQLVTHYTYENGLKILLYTFAGQVGGIGVNNKGLSLTCNTLPEGSKLDNGGLGGVYTTRGMLEQGSVDEAITWLRKVPQFGAYNYSLVDLDKAVMVEHSPLGTEVIGTPAGLQFLAHTNHMLALKDRNKVPGEFPDGLPVGDAADNTLGRLDKVKEMLAPVAESARADDLQEILTTAPVNNSMPTWMTLQSVIFEHDPNFLKMYASAGNDPKRKWNIYTFE